MIKTTITALILALISSTTYADLKHGAVFGFGGSDPHVVTWAGERFEFQYEGEIALVHNPDYSDSYGLHINIKTQLKDWFSFTEVAWIRIGDETIQVQGGKDHSRYWINGEEGFSQLEPREEMTVLLKQGQEVTIRQVTAKQFQLRVDLGNDEGVVIETFEEYLRVDVQANDNGGSFSNSLGLLGSFPEGAKVGRDKSTVFENTEKFAKEWQIPTEDTFFGDTQ